MNPLVIGIARFGGKRLVRWIRKRRRRARWKVLAIEPPKAGAVQFVLPPGKGEPKWPPLIIELSVADLSAERSGIPIEILEAWHSTIDVVHLSTDEILRDAAERVDRAYTEGD